LAADVLRGHLRRDLEVEEHHDVGEPFLGRGLDVFDALDGVDRFLDALRHLALDRLRRGALVHGGDGDDGELDVGEHVDLELPVGRDPQDGQGHHHHGGEDGLLDGEVAQEHGYCLGAWISTGEPDESATGGSRTSTSPAFTPLVTWTASAPSTPRATVRRSALPPSITNVWAWLVPSRTSAAGGTTSAPGNTPIWMLARAKSPPTSAELPGTSTTVSNVRLRSSTRGATRTTRPVTASPGMLSTVTFTGEPTRTLPYCVEGAEARNSRTESSTNVKRGVPEASIAPGSTMRLATRPENGALISVRESCWFTIDASARAWASAASATCRFTSAARRSLSVMPPVLRRLSARSFSTRAWAWFASPTARDARARSALSRKSVGSSTASTSPCAARAPSSRRIWRRRAATSATTCTWARGRKVPVSTTSSCRSRCWTVTVRTGTPRGFASGAVWAVRS